MNLAYVWNASNSYIYPPFEYFKRKRRGECIMLHENIYKSMKCECERKRKRKMINFVFLLILWYFHQIPWSFSWIKCQFFERNFWGSLQKPNQTYLSMIIVANSSAKHAFMMIFFRPRLLRSLRMQIFLGTNVGPSTPCKICLTTTVDTFILNKYTIPWNRTV